MRTTVRKVLFSALAALGGVTPATAVTLELRPEVVATGSYLLLSEVADISDPQHTEGRDDLENLRVALAPSPGKQIVLTRNYLTTSLRYANPVLANQIQWTGADAVIVSAAGQSADFATARKLAEDGLRAFLQTRVALSDVQVIEPIPPLLLPPGVVMMTVKSVKPDSPSRRMSVDVELSVGEHFRRTIPIWFKVRAQLNALVAKENIAPGSLLDPSMFEAKQIELSDASHPVAPGLLPGDSVRATRRIDAGNVLTRSDIERAPPVVRQQRVAVVVLADGMKLETTGIALSDAEVGMPLRLKNPRSGDVFSARVSAPGVATITVK